MLLPHTSAAPQTMLSSGTALSCPVRYPKYNVTAKKLYRRLEALGAAMLLPVCGGAA